MTDPRGTDWRAEAMRWAGMAERVAAAKDAEIADLRRKVEALSETLADRAPFSKGEVRTITADWHAAEARLAALEEQNRALAGRLLEMQTVLSGLLFLIDPAGPTVTAARKIADTPIHALASGEAG